MKLSVYTTQTLTQYQSCDNSLQEGSDQQQLHRVDYPELGTEDGGGEEQSAEGGQHPAHRPAAAPRGPRVPRSGSSSGHILDDDGAIACEDNINVLITAAFIKLL